MNSLSQERKISDAEAKQTPTNAQKIADDHKPDLTGVKIMDGITNAEMYRTVAGCVLIHLVIGTLYVWGTVSPYVASYIRSKDPTIKMKNITMIFPFMVLFVNTSTTVGVKLCNRFPPMYVTIGLASVCLSSVLIVSFMDTLWGYIVFYMIFFGLFSGMLYLIPLKIAWGYFPEKKGTVSGIILFGYGFGSFIFGFVAQAIVNPQNEKPSIPVDEGGHQPSRYFTESVYQEVPKLFRILFACYTCMIVLGILLIKWPHNEKPIDHPIHPHTHPDHPHSRHNSWSWHVVKNENEHDRRHRFVTECPSVMEGVTTYAFWSMFCLAICMIYHGQFLINNFKVYVHTNKFDALDDDSYLTLIGALGAACNGASRIFWATLFDKFGFKPVFFVAATIQAVLSATITLTTGYRSLYAIWMCMSLWCLGGFFATFGPHTAKLFGHRLGPEIYSFVLPGIGVGNLIAFGLRQGNVSIDICFWVGFSFTLIGMVLVFFQKSVYQWEIEEDEADNKNLHAEGKEGPSKLSRRASEALLAKIQKQGEGDVTKETKETEMTVKNPYHKFD